jgi:hypothetical protein
MQKNDLTAFEALLVTERQHLMAGDFPALQIVGAEKEAITQRIAAQSGDLPALRAVLAMAQENQRLILAALRGIQAAQSRLRALRSAEGGMTSYTAQGQAMRLGQTVSRVERRT